MGLLFFLQLFLVALLSGGAQHTHAWGTEGHYIVCKIAQSLLKENASKAVLDLLPKVAGGELGSVCSWADEIRYVYRWSYFLHFVNTPGVCDYNYSRDCHNPSGEKNMCAVGAISNFTAQLETYGDSSSDKYNLTESLMFLGHIVGDIHQPLHAGFLADLGGNRIRVQWYQELTNLHKVWDEKMIQKAMIDLYANNTDVMRKAIQSNLTEGWLDEILEWETCTKSVAIPDKYAAESVQLACDSAYKGVDQNSKLGDDYHSSRLPVVQKRIAQAGVRLATVLNRIFDKTAREKFSKIAVV
ncbi:endonuclease 2 [Cinnamomum micranthum f. kanehirae]|uniref:Aspergillus nuclease S1 n=1 Tax=Cinnamomum micranthum f. kanehirae TaxID=337451 RepID=A0A3S3P5K9_9MAGN|nr:endonuclease 2 [Cinnamomum micranthum f. kanehirae]